MTAPLGPVQVIPPGLTGFFQLKQTGRNPDELLGQYQPIIELRDWFFEARRVDELSLGGPFNSVAKTTGQIGSAALVPDLVVPNNQLWYVEQYTVGCNIATAGDTTAFAGVLFNNSFSTYFQVTPVFVDTITARARNAQVAAPRGFWAQPGSHFGLFIMDILSVGGLTFSVRLRATILAPL